MQYIIVGGSAAAISAVESIRSLDHESRIDLFSDEETPLFSRVLLPYYVAEELSKPLLNFRTSDFFETNRVTPHLGVKVTSLNTTAKSIGRRTARPIPSTNSCSPRGARRSSRPSRGLTWRGSPP